MAEGEVQASIGPPAEPEYLRPVYANQANITFTPHDFSVLFSLFLSPLEFPAGAVESGEVVIRPTAVAHVVVPATLMHGLITLLQTQFGNYLQQFGPPGLEPTGPGGQHP